jgi:hypothetical protein
MNKERRELLKHYKQGKALRIIKIVEKVLDKYDIPSVDQDTLTRDDICDEILDGLMKMRNLY